MDDKTLLKHIDDTVTRILGTPNKEAVRSFHEAHMSAFRGELDLEWQGEEFKHTLVTYNNVPVDKVDDLIAAFTATTLVNDEEALG